MVGGAPSTCKQKHFLSSLTDDSPRSADDLKCNVVFRVVHRVASSVDHRRSDESNVLAVEQHLRTRPCNGGRGVDRQNHRGCESRRVSVERRCSIGHATHRVEERVRVRWMVKQMCAARIRRTTASLFEATYLTEANTTAGRACVFVSHL